MTRDKVKQLSVPALILLVALVASPVTTFGDPTYSGSLDVTFQISAITSSVSGPLTTIPTDLIVTAQTSGITTTNNIGNATSSATGSQNVISAGAPVGDGPAGLVSLDDGFVLSSLVTGTASSPSGTATSSAARSGAVAFHNASTFDSYTINIVLNAVFDLSATTTGLGSSNTGFTINTFQGNNLFDTFTRSVSSPSGSDVASRKLEFAFLLEPGADFGIGVGAGIGGLASVPEPSSAASAVIGMITVLGYGSWRRRTRLRRAAGAI
jgi:hypothetical protein